MHENYVGYMTQLEFKEEIKRRKGVIIVIGSCEQHGFHLPLDTDNLIGFHHAMEVAKLTNCMVMPPINYGQVWSAKDYPGTISLKSETIKMLLKDIVTSLQKQGANNIIIVTGHNGNAGVIKETVRELYDEYNYTNVWHILNDQIDYSDDLKLMDSPLPKVIHASEFETSMLLDINSDLVHLDRCACEYPISPKHASYRPTPWSEYVQSGSFGDASQSTKEKGKKINETAINHIASVINNIIE